MCRWDGRDWFDENAEIEPRNVGNTFQGFCAFRPTALDSDLAHDVLMGGLSNLPT